MIEFLWVLILVASLVGALNCRPTGATRQEGVLACLGQRWRWWLLVGALVLVAGVYLWENILRTLLNLLLFFDRYAAFIIVLLVASLVGFILSWRNEFTGRHLVGAAVLGAVVTFLLVFEWYGLFIGLLFLGLFGLLLTQRDRLPHWLVWSSVLLTTFLAAGLLLSFVLYDQSGFLLDVGDSLLIAAVCIVTAVALLWAWQARAHLFGSACGLMLVLLIAGLILSRRGTDVPMQFAGLVDGAVLVVLLALVWSVVVWLRELPLQPLGWVSAAMILFLGGGLFFSSILDGEAEDFTDIEDQFKYGSIGSDHFMARGIPYFVWEIMPEMFPPEKILMGIRLENKPEKDDEDGESYSPRYGTADGPKGKSYEAFGLLKEEKKKARLLGQGKEVDIDRPIGFSKRRVFGIDFVGLNCAFCHVSTIRKDGSSPPRTVLGMPANTADIELFFQFLFGVAEQERFTPFRVMHKILNKHPEMEFGRQVGASGIDGVRQEVRNAYQRLAYPLALIPLTRVYVKRLKQDFSFIDPHNSKHIPRFGPGRVDAWNPGKATLVKPPLPVEYPGGIIDYESIWNQKAREGMRLHWDGNTNDLEERNIIAGLVVNGPNIECLDTKRMDRITDWIWGLPAPRFEDFRPDGGMNAYGSQDRIAKVERGRVLFEHWCATCHAPDGERVGQVEPLDGGLGTDPARMETFTTELADALNTLGTDQWQLSHFEATKGYANMLLDGIWLRAPYLHNGSIPTMRDLLNKPKDRPTRFCRGIDVYDWTDMGFVATTASPDCVGPNGERYFLFDTRKPGNSNRGHLYGTDLFPEEKDALVAYLKTL